MDPITLIVTALSAGAGQGLKDATASAAADAYSAVKALVRNRFAGRPDGEIVLARHEEAPEVWTIPLTAELTAASAGDDKELVIAAQMLMTLLDSAGSPAGKYVVDVQGSQGIQVGDHNVQHNKFNSTFGG